MLHFLKKYAHYLTVKMSTSQGWECNSGGKELAYHAQALCSGRQEDQKFKITFAYTENPEQPGLHETLSQKTNSETQKTQVGETGLRLWAGQGLPVFIVSVRPAMHQTLTMVLLNSIAVNGSAAFLLKWLKRNNANTVA